MSFDIFDKLRNCPGGGSNPRPIAIFQSFGINISYTSNTPPFLVLTLLSKRIILSRRHGKSFSRNLLEKHCTPVVACSIVSEAHTSYTHRRASDKMCDRACMSSEQLFRGRKSPAPERESGGFSLLMARRGWLPLPFVPILN